MKYTNIMLTAIYDLMGVESALYSIASSLGSIASTITLK